MARERERAPETAALAPLFEITFSGITLDLPNRKLWRWGRQSVLIGLPGDSDNAEVGEITSLEVHDSPCFCTLQPPPIPAE